MYICLLPQIQLLIQQVAIITMQIGHRAIHIPNLIRIERVKDGSQDLELRKFLLSYRNPLYIDVYLSASLDPAFVLASRYNYNAASPSAIHISSLIIIERGFGLEPGPRNLKISPFFFI